jgi:putative CocE/NonD family hydrolase
MTMPAVCDHAPSSVERKMRLFIFAAVAPVLSAMSVFSSAQNMTAEEKQALIVRREAIERELDSIAIIDHKVMVPMRDGKRMAADIYRPKDETRKYPIIFFRTPYNTNFWDVKLGTYADMSRQLGFLKHGYATIEMTERGHFFSEGTWDILGAPLTDADDELTWMGALPWTNGKVGLIGCSSSAEWQLGAASLGNKALATIMPRGFGAGVGKVGPYSEQGTWYRGGAMQMWFIVWLYSDQNTIRPMFSPETTQAERTASARMFDLAPQMPPVDWAKALEHLPVNDIMNAVGGPHGIFADKVENTTGGAMIQRTPSDPAWRKGGLWQSDTMPINVPGLWMMSWYDLSIGPNLAAYNFVRAQAHGDVANQQYAIIAPTGHCGFGGSEHTVVGERDMGDARFDYDALIYGWFDHFLKGEDNHILEKTPKVEYYTIGLNKWQHSDTWPPEHATTATLWLTSGGHANTLHGDGVLAEPPQKKPPLFTFVAAGPAGRSNYDLRKTDLPDVFTYDPMHPTPSYGGNICCAGNSIAGDPGSLDQRKMEERPEILVYTSPPLASGVEVSGPVTVTLYVSSDVKDTDVTAKLIDVLPNGSAYNLDETIQRLRYRDGDDHTVSLDKGKVYKVTLTPLNTSVLFGVGHRIRLEVAGSNFPRFDRNLNTGGNNYDETESVIAHSAIHHSELYPSAITFTVVPKPSSLATK